MIPHLQQLAHSPVAHPEHVIADVGYGSEANYLYLIEGHYQGLILYNQLRKEEKRRFKNDLSNIQDWDYHEPDDVFICPHLRGLKKVPRGIRIISVGAHNLMKKVKLDFQG